MKLSEIKTIQDESQCPVYNEWKNRELDSSAFLKYLLCSVTLVFISLPLSPKYFKEQLGPITIDVISAR